MLLAVTLFFCDPGINTFATTRHLLHTAAVCCAASCYPSHNRGPAKWDACSHVCPAYPSSPPQWRHHGYGRWHHYGHVSWWASFCFPGVALSRSMNEKCRNRLGLFLWLKTDSFCVRNFVDNSITSTCCPPPSHDAHISASWHTQLQLCAPTVVKRGPREYEVFETLSSVMYRLKIFFFFYIKVETDVVMLLSAAGLQSKR